MDFKPGDLARTRDGRKAFIVNVVPHEIYCFVGVIVGHEAIIRWAADGKYVVENDHPQDLIGPWEEPKREGDSVWAEFDGDQLVFSEPPDEAKISDYRAGWRFYAGAALTGLLANAGINEDLSIRCRESVAAEIATAMMEEEGKL